MLKSSQLDKEIIRLLKLNTVNLETENSKNENLEHEIKSLKELIVKAYSSDSMIKEVRKIKKREDRKLFERLIKEEIKITMKNISIRDNRIYFKKRLCISNAEKLQLHLFRRHHDSFMQNYFDYQTMYLKLSENYYWMNMKKTCRQYVTNCSICRRVKVYNIQKQKLLTSLSILERKWIDLSMNFVVNLLKCRRRNRIYENILIVVNRLIKKRVYESMKLMNTKNLWEVLHWRIFSCYEFLRFIVSDREDQIIFKLWQRICQKYDIKSKLSSTHHLETNEQIENVNKTLKNYFRVYVRYVQNDWMNFLSDVEFAANNHENASTRLISFFADHEYHSRSEAEFSKLYYQQESRKIKLIRADKIIKHQKTIQQFLIKRLLTVQNDYQKNANTFKQSHLNYKIEDLVYVNVKNFFFARQSKSLSSKNLESWRIVRNIDNKTYKLNIFKNLKSARIVSIFHSWKLHLTFLNSFSK